MVGVEMKINLILGDCLETLRSLPGNSIDSIVTDPPYGISFMGKKWDYEVPSVEVFKEMLRVLKPGGHMLCACGTRTQHRMAVNIEDAGFEIRDVVTWLYGSGFPKSMDISKAIDKQSGITEWKETVPNPAARPGNGVDALTSTGWAKPQRPPKPVVETVEAKQWQGWGTALKPACEFWTLARKPLSEKTVAENVLKYGTGAVNIDGSRIETNENLSGGAYSGEQRESSRNSFGNGVGGGVIKNGIAKEFVQPQGRWPANLMLDEEAAEALDEQSGILKSGASKSTYIQKESENTCLSGKNYQRQMQDRAADSGGASRFFYVAKASKSDRGPGNIHPTVKPIKLMQYLVKMITPPGGVVLDPYMGSGSTGVAAIKEGFQFTGIEREESYYEICKARIGAMNV